MAKYLMGIDAGNTSTKAVLFDVDGNFIASASKSAKEYPRRGPGFEEFDVDQQWDNCVACIRATLEKANATGDDILGIGNLLRQRPDLPGQKRRKRRPLRVLYRQPFRGRR